MKLSDAAVLGAATWQRVCYPVLTRAEARTKGCFLQLALMAVGCSAKEVAEDSDKDGVPLWAIKIQEFWPWVGEPTSLEPYVDSHDCVIWKMNDAGAPFEEILAYVRSVEPAEPQADPQASGVAPALCCASVEVSR